MKANRALFEKLTDDELDVDFEKVPKKFVSLAELQNSILENLQLLLNTRVAIRWKEYIENDVINDAFPFSYGINATGAVFADNIFEMQALETHILNVIKRFEPRLHNINVHIEVKQNPNRVYVNIDANVRVEEQEITLFFPVVMTNFA